MKPFEEIYNAYYRRVFAFLYKLCQDRELTEDLTQETFYQAFASFSKFRGDSDIFTWLAAIAKRCYYRYLKKNKLSIEALSLDRVLEFYGGQEKAATDDALQKKESVLAIKSVLKELPQIQQDVIMLRVYAELSFRQVGQALNISENSAKVIYFRAKNKLAKEIYNESVM